MRSQNSIKTRRMVLLALMLAMALVIHIVESMLPSLVFIVPGLKLGLTNIITLIMIYKFRVGECILIVFLRVMIASIFGGGPSMFLFSLTGALFSLFVMLFAKKERFLGLSTIGVSVLGSIFFNIGQLTVAAFMIKSASIFSYLPIMGLMSIATGIFVGLVANSVLKNKALMNLF